MRTALLALLTLAASAAMCAAEVRVVQENGELSLDVQTAGNRIWSPVRGSGPGYAINVAGDLQGDGYPTYVRADGELVAAWHRPSHGIVVTRAGRAGEIATTEVSAPEAIGTPALVPIRDGLLAFWSSSRGIAAVHISADGAQSSTVEIDEGTLVGAEPLGNEVVAVVMVPATRTLRVLRWLPAPQPFPIPSIELEVVLPKSGVVQTPCITSEAGGIQVSWRGVRGTVVHLDLVEGVPGTVVTEQGGNPCGPSRRSTH